MQLQKKYIYIPSLWLRIGNWKKTKTDNAKILLFALLFVGVQLLKWRLGKITETAQICKERCSFMFSCFCGIS